MKAVGLENYAVKVGHVGVLRGIFKQEKIEEKTVNQIMQLMDKKLYDDALKLVKEVGASKKCVTALQKLVSLKGEKVFGVAEKMRESVDGYEQSVAAVENLQEILTLLSESGCKINMSLEAGFARGLEYYTGIIFELYAPELDIALGGGGRYDKLIELFGGEPTPAVGIAHGIDRIMLVMQKQKVQLETAERRRIMVIPTKDEVKSEALKIAERLRKAGMPVEVEVMGRKITKALEDADRRKMSHALIVGERELKEDAVVLRDLVKREQKIVKISKIVESKNW
jgi:histidyl-tRNA synthetase